MITKTNVANQRQACESGCIEVLLKMLTENSNKDGLIKKCYMVLGCVLSNQEVYAEYCTPQVIETVKKAVSRRNDCKDAEMFLKSLERKEDERVKECVAKGVCMKTAFPRCARNCRSDEGFLCPDCCVQQKCYKCLDCEKDKAKFYCEVCWNKYHKDHNCAEFFYPVRCTSEINK